MFRIAKNLIILDKTSEKFFIEQLEMDEEKIVILENAIPDPKIENKVLSKDHLKFLFLGRLEQEKGIDITLDVAEQMPEKEFIIAGTTKKEKIKQRINDLENVEHLGYVEDMKEAYKQTRIVLVPSKWEEPYGRIPIEAGASGIPTIATSNGGLSESVGNSELLVDSEDSEKFVEKIKEVEEKYEKFSEKARENTEEKSQEKQLEKFEGLMEDVKK